MTSKMLCIFDGLCIFWIIGCLNKIVLKLKAKLYAFWPFVHMPFWGTETQTGLKVESFLNYDVMRMCKSQEYKKCPFKGSSVAHWPSL